MMGKRLMGDARPDDASLTTMRERGGKWAAYQNHDMGHPALGHLTFLQYGGTCTYKLPPERHPDTPQMIGWRYTFVGGVDLDTGGITEDTAFTSTYLGADEHLQGSKSPQEASKGPESPQEASKGPESPQEPSDEGGGTPET